MKQSIDIRNINIHFYTVVYIMHEMIKEQGYDELVVAMVSCKVTSSSFLKYYDKDLVERYN